MMASSAIEPHDVRAEQAVLGSMLIDPRDFAAGVRALTASDFFLTAHQLLFAQLRRLHAEGQPVDAVILERALRDRGDLDAIGGQAALALLLEVGAPPSTSRLMSRSCRRTRPAPGRDSVRPRADGRCHQRLRGPRADRLGRPPDTDPRRRRATGRGRVPPISNRSPRSSPPPTRPSAGSSPSCSRTA